MKIKAELAMAAVLLALSLFLTANGVLAQGSACPVKPSDYPVIGDQELGQLRWTLNLANQPLDDFKNLEGLDQLGMTSFRYGLAFSAYFLATEQYHKLPAWSEALQPALDRLIRKMLEKRVWEFWAKVSRGVPTLEPKMNMPYPENRDPVSNMNIMYSGHVGHMVGLYEMLYRDFKYDQPGAITFVWSPTQKFVYNHTSLIQVMYNQMKNNPYHAICCEPNAVFPECNQHPILSFMLHDITHGSNFAPVRELFMDFFLQKKMIHPQTHETAMLYLVKQDLTVANKSPFYRNAMDLVIAPAVSLGIITLDSSSANGWTGAFMHAWQPDFIERHYPYQREHHLQEMNQDEARLDFDYWEPYLKYGFFAVLAGEMGDAATRDRILRYADTKFQPVWENGAFHYPYNLARKCTHLTDKLLALAKANPKSGLWALHNRPFTAAHFAAPRLSGVDFPNLLLLRAIYDESKKALVITTAPGQKKSGASAFKIVNLDPAQSYRLFLDGRETKPVSGESGITVQVTLTGPHDVVLVAE